MAENSKEQDIKKKMDVKFRRHRNDKLMMLLKNCAQEKLIARINRKDNE